MFVYLVIGALLAQRYKVFALIPAMAVAIALAVFSGVRLGATLWQMIFSAGLDVAALQVGYFAGSGIQFLAKSLHAVSTRSDAPGASMWSRRSTQN